MCWDNCFISSSNLLKMFKHPEKVKAHSLHRLGWQIFWLWCVHTVPSAREASDSSRALKFSVLPKVLHMGVKCLQTGRACKSLAVYWITFCIMDWESHGHSSKWKTLEFSTLYSLCLWGVGWWDARQVLFSLLSPQQLSGEMKRGFQDKVFFCGVNMWLKQCLVLPWDKLISENGVLNTKYFLLRERVPRFSLVYTYQHS